MPCIVRPRLTKGGHGNCAEMPKSHRLHLTTGGRGSHAAMPCNLRPLLTTGGHWVFAAMPCNLRPRLILVPPQGRRNANQCSRQWEGSINWRSNASLSAPFPTIQQGAAQRPQKCHIDRARLTTGGRESPAEMPTKMHPRLTTGSHYANAEMSQS